jgi:hypothetical protein
MVTFEIVKRSEVSIDPPAFACDKPIHPQIEFPLPAKAFFMTILGSAGSGKTSALISMLKSKKAYRKAFHNVFVVVPRHSLASLKKNIFENHDKVYDELNYETLDKIREVVREDAEAEDGALNSLLLIDDQTVHLKDLEVQGLLREMIFNRRHLHLSIIILAQSYNQIPLPVRKTVSHLMLFRPRNKKEYRSIFEEIIPQDKDTADALCRYVFRDQYDFLFCDVDKNEVFKNFHQIEIKE